MYEDGVERVGFGSEQVVTELGEASCHILLVKTKFKSETHKVEGTIK